MTHEQAEEALQSIDLLRQTVRPLYAQAKGAEEYALSVVLNHLEEIRIIVNRCAE